MKRSLPMKYEQKKIRVSDGLGFAWDKATFLEFLDDNETAMFAILGGDVLILDSTSGYKLTYDSWSIDRNGANEDFKVFCQRSRKKAQEYVSTYNIIDGIVFAPVMTTEITAGL